MPLTIRSTGLTSPVDKDRPDFTIYSGDWAMGGIYEQRGGPAHHVIGRTSVPQIIGLLVCSPLRALAPEVHEPMAWGARALSHQ